MHRITLPKITWLTDDLTLLPEVKQAVELVGATFHLVQKADDLPDQPPTILAWACQTYDEAVYHQLKEYCPQLIIFMERGRQRERLCPIRSRFAPLYYLVTPFEAEEFAIILRGIIDRSQRRPSLSG